MLRHILPARHVLPETSCLIM